MPEVIKWSVVGGSLVFAIGLVSAIGSRMQRRVIDTPSTDERPVKETPVYVVVSTAAGKPDATEYATAMSMAAKGTGNVSIGAFNGKAEENLASIGSHTR